MNKKQTIKTTTKTTKINKQKQKILTRLISKKQNKTKKQTNKQSKTKQKINKLDQPKSENRLWGICKEKTKKTWRYNNPQRKVNGTSLKIKFKKIKSNGATEDLLNKRLHFCIISIQIYENFNLICLWRSWKPLTCSGWFVIICVPAAWKRGTYFVIIMPAW